MRIGLGGMALAALVTLACGRLKPASSDGAPPGTEPDASLPTTDDTKPPPEDATTAPPLDAAIAPTGRPLPADVRAPVRFADARALLVGNGPDACTHQTPPSGDGHRWCAFTQGAAMNGVAGGPASDAAGFRRPHASDATAASAIPPSPIRIGRV